LHQELRPTKYGIQTNPFCILGNDDWRMYVTRLDM
jgi:hypothetical protein